MIELEAADLERAFGHPVSTCEVEAIDPHLRIHSVTGGVYRVRAGGESLVVKVVRHGVDATPDQLWQSGADPAHRNYWKREWLAFDTALLDALPGRLRAPRTALTTEKSNGDCWIWMEDVGGRTAGALEHEDFATIAHALGTMQGAYACGVQVLPNQPWLSRDWLRGWVDLCARFIDVADDDARWTDDRLSSLAPLRPRILDLWSRRDDLLAISDEAPPTLVHWDFWPTNLFVEEDDVVAIDWSQIGIGGVTHDLDQLTLDTVWMHIRPEESLEVLEDVVLPAYVSGLHDGGLDASLTEISRWYAASAALRYAWLAGGQAEIVDDPQRVHFQEFRYARDLTNVFATKARVVQHALDLGERALGR